MQIILTIKNQEIKYLITLGITEVWETGLPYDFSIQKNDQNVIFIDVKSTNFKFEQPLIFSNQEIECIADKSNYHIYRYLIYPKI